MSEWTTVARVEDFSDTGTLRVSVSGVAVCLYHVAGDVFATQDTCPHGQASLSEGWLEDCTIECPLHQAVFDVRSGKRLGPPVTDDLKTFAARIEDGAVLLDLAQ